MLQGLCPTLPEQSWTMPVLWGDPRGHAGLQAQLLPHLPIYQVNFM